MKIKNEIQKTNPILHLMMEVLRYLLKFFVFYCVVVVVDFAIAVVVAEDKVFHVPHTCGD